MNVLYGTPIEEVRRGFAKGREHAISMLQGIVARFTEELKSAPEPEAAPNTTARKFSNRIFVVHGHEDGPREAVARFLEAIGFDPVILHEQPNKGRALITKFREESADVGFAVIVMTPDDEGGEHGARKIARARQNVVFEFGYFLGFFGPERVVALVKGEVERPSDLDGVVYIDFDPAGGWKQKIGKELEAANYKIDWNKIMR